MATKSSPLHILFFPFLAHGHLLPMADLARLFALRDTKCTMVTTPANEPLIRPTVDRANKILKNTPNLAPITITLIPFPSDDIGLPAGFENAACITSHDTRQKFVRSISYLEKPFEHVLINLHPDAFISDTFFAWSAAVSERVGIPRLVFNGSGLFSHCCESIILPLIESLRTDLETVSISGLPHQIEMCRSQLLVHTVKDEDFLLLKKATESDAKSYGEVVNSFLELESGYAKHYREAIGRRAWVVGPVALCNEELMDKSRRGGEIASTNLEELLHWLDSKKPGSVMYVSFGTLSKFSNEQLMHLALALEGSSNNFIWVLTNEKYDCSDEWLPRELKELIEKKKGLIVRGWAPQLLILNHHAVGGFMTHCGWNSTIEAASAGVPMITWPLYVDQFFNEKLVVDVLRVGAAVGAKENSPNYVEKKLIHVEAIRSAIERVMGGGEAAEAMTQRAKELKEKAHSAVQEGGSSNVDLHNLIQELMARRDSRLGQN